MKKIISLTCFLVVLLSLTGCGPKRTVIFGTVTYDGEPAHNIAVLFQADSDRISSKQIPEPGTGNTDDKGNYTIRTLDMKKRGVEPGYYKLFIQWVDPEPMENVSDDNAARAELESMKRNPYMAKGKPFFDNRFSVEVPSKGPFELNIDLAKPPEFEVSK